MFTKPKFISKGDPNSSQKVINENNVETLCLDLFVDYFILYIYNLRGNVYILRRGETSYMCVLLPTIIPEAHQHFRIR